ncbi:hypothetical protein E4U43_005820 [Claviceps pusilla]|uniref:Complex 1 LYR protein domain-containing protein n=1 Tax=Claviceps pusilla TaxID=123648 RepID=A0A9P7T2J0_9HYPO|nr:hypothetical protein E4U43_005820 [Claviceps pusilla]
MHRQPFVPARNSRHRIAALSLYRALLRSAGKIVLPNDLQTQLSRNAIQHVIRKRFADNRPLTSFRLVYASMVAGYKFLSLFSKALDQTSPEYTQITSQLRSSRRPALSPRDQSPPQRPPAREPFLMNISQNDSPHYVPNYTLHSKKRTLNLCATADGQPFLRLKKPQPRSLSKMIGRKGMVFQKKIIKCVEVDEDLKQEAALEDQWEGLVAAQMSKEGLSVEEYHAANDSHWPSSSYSWSVQLSKLWWEWQLEKMWQDWVARGEALNRIVEQQKSRTQGRGSASSTVVSSSLSARGNPPAVQGSKTAPERNSTGRPNVSVFSAAPFPFTEAIDAELRHLKILPPKREVDPFIGPRWNALVRSQTPRLSGWIRGQAKRDRGYF